jgi:hypothetical protein
LKSAVKFVPSCAALLALFLSGTHAFAQDPYGQPGLSPGFGPSPQQEGKKGKNKPPPGTPETHAASGADDS